MMRVPIRGLRVADCLQWHKSVAQRSASLDSLLCCGPSDMYAPMLGRSIAIDRLFLRLQSRIQQEIKLDKQLLALQGGLDLVMASAGQQSVAHAESALAL